MTTTPSLRKMWTIYKKLLVEDSMSRRDQVLAQSAFYSGARGVLQVLDHMLAKGEDEAVHQTIKRFGRQIRAIQGLRPRARRH